MYTYQGQKNEDILEEGLSLWGICEEVFGTSPRHVELLGEGSNECRSFRIGVRDENYKCYECSNPAQAQLIVELSSGLRKEGIPVPMPIGIRDHVVFAEWVEGRTLSSTDRASAVERMASYQARLHGATVSASLWENKSLTHVERLFERLLRYRCGYVDEKWILRVRDEILSSRPDGTGWGVLHPDFIITNIVETSNKSLVIIDNEFLCVGHGQEWDILNTLKVSFGGDKKSQDRYLSAYSEQRSLHTLFSFWDYWEKCYDIKMAGKHFSKGRVDEGICHLQSILENESPRPIRVSRLTKGEIENEVRRLCGVQPWWQDIELPFGIFTCGRPEGELKANHNVPKWDKIEAFLPSGARRAIDLGCNEGYFCLKLIEAGMEEVVGIDVDQHRIEKASFVVDVLQVKDIGLVQADIYELDNLELGHFDLALCLGMLHRVPDPYRLLATVGRLADTVILEWSGINTDDPIMRFWGGGFKTYDVHNTGYWRPSRACVKQILQRHGYNYFHDIEAKCHRAILLASKHRLQLGIPPEGIATGGHLEGLTEKARSLINKCWKKFTSVLGNLDRPDKVRPQC